MDASSRSVHPENNFFLCKYSTNVNHLFLSLYILLYFGSDEASTTTTTEMFPVLMGFYGRITDTETNDGCVITKSKLTVASSTYPTDEGIVPIMLDKFKPINLHVSMVLLT
jgi:hypothetical protein